MKFIKIQSCYCIYMRVYCFYVVVVYNHTSWYKTKKLYTAIRQSYNHCLCLRREHKFGNLNWIISGPNSHIPIRFLLQLPTLYSTQWQNELSLLVILPWKFRIGNSCVKFLQRTIISCRKYDIILSIVHINDDLAIIIVLLLDFELPLELWFIYQHCLRVLSQKQKL